MTKVSILIPTYNRAQFLREAIRSAIEQTHRDLEILILDDASPDTTADVAAEFAGDPRVQYVWHPNNLGIAGNWRAGIERSKGKFFCLLHDDDTFEPTFVESLLNPLLADPSLILAFCDHWVMDTKGTRDVPGSADTSKRFGRHLLPEGNLADFPHSALVDSSLPVGATLFRRSRVDISFITEQAKGSIDSWLFYQCVGTGYGAYYLPERLMNYRTHEGGMSASMPLHMGEGHLFRYQEILADARLTPIHAKIKQLLASTLTSYGISLLRVGRRAEARNILRQSLNIKRSLRARIAYSLSCTGVMGTQAAKFVRS